MYNGPAMAPNHLTALLSDVPYSKGEVIFNFRGIVSFVKSPHEEMRP